MTKREESIPDRGQGLSTGTEAALRVSVCPSGRRWKTWRGRGSGMPQQRAGAETSINVSLMVGVGHTPATLEGVGARIKRQLSAVL